MTSGVLRHRRTTTSLRTRRRSITVRFGKCRLETGTGPLRRRRLHSSFRKRLSGSTVVSQTWVSTPPTYSVPLRPAATDGERELGMRKELYEPAREVYWRPPGYRSYVGRGPQAVPAQHCHATKEQPG